MKPISSEQGRTLARATTRIFLSALVSASLSFAATIYDSGLAAIKATDPIQLGRLNRTGVPSDWSAPKAFPGVLNATVSYRYEAFVLPSILYPFVQITMDDLSGTGQTFASAYLGSYRPSNTLPNNGLNLNYLGDEGVSGNPFGTDPAAFQVVVPVGGTLVVVVNDASPIAAGVGQPFRLLVEGFFDTNFSNTAPEPATYGFIGIALALGFAVVRRRRLPA
jgi:hypothetical protein